MKKLIILIVALSSITTLSAQVKGEKVVGGLLGVSATSIITSGGSTSSSDSASFHIAPEFGYFVANKLRIGAKLECGIESNTQSIQILPNIAYYVRLCDGLFYAPELKFGFVAGIYGDIVRPGLSVGLSLGNFEFRPTQRFGMSVNLLSLDYLYMSYQNDSVNGVVFKFGASPSVGLRYYF